MKMKTPVMLKMFEFRRVCSRLKNIQRRLNMKSIKVSLVMVTVYLCLIVLIIYHICHISFAQYHLKSDKTSQQITSTKHYFDTPMRHIPYNEIYKNIKTYDVDLSIETEDSRQVNMIDTPGCVIPVAMVNYKKNMHKRKNGGCGMRIVYITKYGDDNVEATVSEIKMKKHIKIGNKYDCCYRFFQRSNKPGQEHLKIQYTPCKNLRNGEKIKLESDFINVQCFEYDISNKSHLIYNDDYTFCKKNNLSHVKKKINQDKYNVLIIGMDSMSLPRFAQTMTRTINFFQNNHWLGYRGYHKVGDNTFPNLLSALTGKRSSTIIKNCYRKMDQCNDYFLWSMFKKSGYVSAYGEDYLHLPDTFSRDFIFRNAPTDHYMRPFFLNREYEINNRSQLCSGKVTSGQQMMDFAHDFAFTYRNDSFFGFFWMNSFSHNLNNHPSDADLLLENFFNRLVYTGILDNTFIVFMSDHGIRFGKHRLQMESYYDNRMPLLFFWVPRAFKSNYPEKFKAIIINQFRLITPYDLFDTLSELNELAGRNSIINPESTTRNYKTISKRQSMFSIISANRTCRDVGIHEKWCSCHKLYPLEVTDTEGVKSVNFVAYHIKTVLKNIKTKQCWSCLDLSLQNISRVHFYYDSDKINLYYVVAFSMGPKNVFYEAVVLRNNTRLDLVGAINIISQYEGFGDCTIKRSDRIFCVCQKNS